ncbi:MAG: NAD(P)-dependent dehydrogenase (short-subunit alcohol dehydrogenase family) [Glaciecola sp.]|jgi:NAD(P)-dependent dehydrogenase (short-subunit alcohol dehydrogenase family)
MTGVDALLAGRVALVTGGAAGIGEAIVTRFADVALFLASEPSSYMTGAVIEVTGGRHL